MRRKWWAAIILSLLAMICGLLVILVQPSRNVSVTFLCYTQDPRGIRRDRYRVPYNGPNSMAAFRVEKRGRSDYGFSVKALELKRPDGWVIDTNASTLLAVGLVSEDPRFAPFVTNTMDVLLPRPVATSSWRCRIEFVELPRHVGWKATTRHWLTQVGLINPTNLTRFEVVSEEIGR